MKQKIILLLAVLFLSATAAKAKSNQNLFGPQVGLNLSNYVTTNVRTIYAGHPLAGIRAGFVGDIHLKGKLSLQIAPAYVRNGYIDSVVGFYHYTMIVKMTGIELPVSATIKVDNILFLAGPYLVCNLKGNYSIKKSNLLNENYSLSIGNSIRDDIKRYDMGVRVGMSYCFKNGIFLTAIYQHGINNIHTNSPLSGEWMTLRQSSFGFSFGVAVNNKN